MYIAFPAGFAEEVIAGCCIHVADPKLIEADAARLLQAAGTTGQHEDFYSQGLPAGL